MSVLRRLTLSLLPLFALASFSAGSSAATDIDKEAFISKFEKLGMPVIDVVPHLLTAWLKSIPKAVCYLRLLTPNT